MNNSIFKNKHFYVMLVLCMCVLGAVVYINRGYINHKKTEKADVTSNMNSKSGTAQKSDMDKTKNLSNKDSIKNKSNSNPKDKAKKKVNLVKTNNKATLKEKSTENNKKVMDNTKKQSSVSKSANKSNLPEKVKSISKINSTESNSDSIACFAEPISNGILLKPYSYRCQFSKTLNEYEIHPALDIKAKLGSDVLASSDGMVKAIKNDERFGKTIIIDNGNRLMTQYSNLADKVLVTLGQAVKKGQKIGTVGDTAIFECADEPHLHFAVIRDNQYVNPDNYFADKKVVSKYQESTYNKSNTNAKGLNTIGANLNPKAKSNIENTTASNITNSKNSASTVNNNYTTSNSNTNTAAATNKTKGNKNKEFSKIKSNKATKPDKADSMDNVMFTE